ncbi:lytic transglycosylase domain-containing protein [Campylobacter sp. RM16192]|uniref:lytic transglycosylase domain-containing protein n=1 Tax=Campylobacter sp. RM16192 TaxID=1660080 RepID=UPI0014517164|nr:lytic transglycosylase domain-containing protein [Campylobacter sp. RM16192]QCD52955.1 soluble lytic murein transglycosylase [Campylobacter sp. RM16192]
MLIRFNITLIIYTTLLFGGVKSFNEIKDQEKGLAKDYYIYRLITEGNYTINQVEELNKDIFRRSPTMIKALNTIIKPELRPTNCAKINAKNIVDANLTCQKALLKIPFMLKIAKKDREKLAKKFDDINKTVARNLKTLNSKNPALKFDKFKDARHFIELFEASDKKHKELRFNQKFSTEFINLLAKEQSFQKIINRVIIDKELPKFRANFLNIKDDLISDQIAYILGINAILLGSKESAFKFFKRAENSFKNQGAKDAAIFWQYLIIKEKALLEVLNSSSDINIYTLYANEKTGKPLPKVFSPAPTKEKVRDYDIKDPFLWQKTFAIIKEINATKAAEFAELFNTKETLGQHAYFMEKASGYKDHYFVMPFLEELDDINASRKTLIYAIGKQESRFIPAVISTSYALGMMQFMPFLANHIAKKELMIEGFDQDDMFDPRVALRFADHHLNYLEKFLHHPLFIAYAYNGGIGFTKRVLQRGDLFNDGEFEPFLSIDLIPYTESRIYGKKVLANYIIYSNLLNSNTSILKLFEILKEPSLTDKFRTRP